MQAWVLKHRVSSATTELDPIKVVRFIIKVFQEGFEIDPTFHKLRLGIKAIKARWDNKIMHDTITFRRPQSWQSGNPRSSGNNQKKRKRDTVTSTANSLTIKGGEVTLADLDRLELNTGGGDDNIDLDLQVSSLEKVVNSGTGDDVVDAEFEEVESDDDEQKSA